MYVSVVNDNCKTTVEVRRADLHGSGSQNSMHALSILMSRSAMLERRQVEMWAISKVLSKCGSLICTGAAPRISCTLPRGLSYIIGVLALRIKFLVLSREKVNFSNS